MELLWGALLIRLLNLILWIAAAEKLRSQPEPPTRLARRMIVSVLVVGAIAFMIGGLVPFGFPGEAARWIYTITAAYSSIVAAAIVTSEDLV